MYVKETGFFTLQPNVYVFVFTFMFVCPNCCTQAVVTQLRGVDAILRILSNTKDGDSIVEPSICTLRHLTSRHQDAELAQVAIRNSYGIPVLVTYLQPQYKWSLIKVCTWGVWVGLYGVASTELGLYGKFVHRFVEVQICTKVCTAKCTGTCLCRDLYRYIIARRKLNLLLVSVLVFFCSFSVRDDFCIVIPIKLFFFFFHVLYFPSCSRARFNHRFLVHPVGCDWAGPQLSLVS